MSVENGPLGEALAFLVLLLYNGRRGFVTSKAGKYAFYVYYPAHLMVLWAIK